MGIAFKGGIASHSASTFLWHLDDLDVFNLKTLTKSSRMNCLLLCVFEHAPSYGIYLALSAFVWRALPSRNCTYTHTGDMKGWKTRMSWACGRLEAISWVYRRTHTHTYTHTHTHSQRTDLSLCSEHMLEPTAWLNKNRREGDRKKREEEGVVRSGGHQLRPQSPSAPPRQPTPMASPEGTGRWSASPSHPWQ